MDDPPSSQGYANSDKKTYLYHHSTHPYGIVEGKVLLPRFAFLVEGGKDPILVDTGMAGQSGPASIITRDRISPRDLRFMNALPLWELNAKTSGWSSSPTCTGITSFTWRNSSMPGSSPPASNTSLP